MASMLSYSPCTRIEPANPDVTCKRAETSIDPGAGRRVRGRCQMQFARRGARLRAKPSASWRKTPTTRRPLMHNSSRSDLLPYHRSLNALRDRCSHILLLGRQPHTNRSKPRGTRRSPSRLRGARRCRSRAPSHSARHGHCRIRRSIPAQQRTVQVCPVLHTKPKRHAARSEGPLAAMFTTPTSVVHRHRHNRQQIGAALLKSMRPTMLTAQSSGRASDRLTAIRVSRRRSVRNRPLPR